MSWVVLVLELQASNYSKQTKSIFTNFKINMKMTHFFQFFLFLEIVPCDNNKNLTYPKYLFKHFLINLLWNKLLDKQIQIDYSYLYYLCFIVFFLHSSESHEAFSLSVLKRLRCPETSIWQGLFFVKEWCTINWVSFRKEIQEEFNEMNPVPVAVNPKSMSQKKVIFILLKFTESSSLNFP